MNNKERFESGTEPARAFPHVVPPDESGCSLVHHGLTKREYAAIQIAAGFRGLETWTYAEIARAAANQADALLAELERTETK